MNLIFITIDGARVDRFHTGLNFSKLISDISSAAIDGKVTKSRER